MGTELSTATLRDALAERLRSSFVNLIPEDAWKELVEKEIKVFTSATPPRYSGGPYEPSPLSVYLREEIKIRLKEMVAKEFQKPEYQAEYDLHGNMLGGTVVKKMMEELAPTMIRSMFEGIVQQTVLTVAQQMRQ